MDRSAALGCGPQSNAAVALAVFNAMAVLCAAPPAEAFLAPLQLCCFLGVGGADKESELT